MTYRHPSLRPRSPLAAGKPLVRRTPLAPLGKKWAEKYEARFNGWHAERLRRRDCDGLPDGSHAPGCRIAASLNFRPGVHAGKNEASHVVKRSRGGLYFHLVSQSAACHDEMDLLPADERLTMLPLALRLAWQSHHACPDLVPAPPIPEEVDP